MKHGLIFGFAALAVACGPSTEATPDDECLGTSACHPPRRVEAGAPVNDGGTNANDGGASATDGGIDEGGTDGGAQTAVLVSAGASHTCAKLPGAKVKCWGSNLAKQSGHPTDATVPTPREVDGLPLDVIAIAAGGEFSCALTKAGSVKCWGANYSGQLGNNDAAKAASANAVDVVGLASGVTAISAAFGHACAVVAGAVKCWGAHPSASQTAAPAPVQVPGLTAGAASVVSGSSHACALTTAGGVKCWGRNPSGALGHSAKTNDFVGVGDVVGLTSGVKAIAGRIESTCALTTSGGVKCWGNHNDGQLGNGVAIGYANGSAIPVDVTGLTSGALAITTGYVGCAVLATGVKCWGANQQRELGNNSSDVHVATPMDVSNLGGGVTAITSDHHACVAIGTSVRCWGANGQGQVGIGAAGGNVLTPMAVVGL